MNAIATSSAVIAILIFLAIELIVFRSGFYSNIVHPASFAGMLMQRYHLAKGKNGNSGIALIGDSRLREGFSAQVFNHLSGPNSLYALNLALSGSFPRVWYYFLKQVDPHRQAFKYIVIALPSYWDEDYNIDTCDRQEDLQLLLPILSFADSFEFAHSYHDHTLGEKALFSVCLKMHGFRHDLKDFLSNPKQRFENAKYFDDHWLAFDYDYQGKSESLAGARMLDGGIINLPTFLTSSQKHRLNILVKGLSEKEINNPFPYLHYWLDKLSTRYVGSSTKIIFVPIPSFAFARQPLYPVHTDALKAAARFPNVMIMPVDTFDFLHKPEYFADDVHLNAVGRKLYSSRLATELFKYAHGDIPTVAQTRPKVTAAH